MSTDDFDIVPTHLAIQAMRDNGYKNAAYALAELIDNSIQAGASSVELLCREHEEPVKQRTRRRIEKIAVLDNGHGMDADVLRMALQFGNGTRLGDRSGIGRFGMGLPSASISQCQRVDVWSWQEGPEDALYTYIDLSEVGSGSLREIPAPIKAALPAEWTSVANGISNSGTLVVWSKLDRVMWRTAKAVIENSEFLIGRMYRKFIDDGVTDIRLVSLTTSGEVNIDRLALVNDPGYLMVPSSTPSPYDSQPLFQKDGDHWEVISTVDYDGSEHEIAIRFTYALEDARKLPNAGSTNYGKHAAKNVGVSLVRAGRELELDESFVISYDPTERWWGVEVEFPPALDELFGVTNNKQSARHFTEVATNLKTILAVDEGETHQALFEMDEDGDPTATLVQLMRTIESRLSVLRNLIKIQTKGTKKASKRNFDPASAEAQGTQATRERQEEGLKGESDEGEALPEQERKDKLAQELIETGYTPDDAIAASAHMIDNGLKYTFAEADLEGQSFFTVRPVGGEIVIKINTNHPAHSNLLEVLEEDDLPETPSEDELRDRLIRASRGLKLLLMAWARYEDEQPSSDSRRRVQDIRTDWGRMAFKFIERSH